MNNTNFVTFHAENASRLNEAIASYCKVHYCVEIRRSTPAIGKNDDVFVTSEFRNMTSEEKDKLMKAQENERYQEKTKNYISIFKLEIPNSIKFALERANLNYVEEVVEESEEQLLRIRGLGPNRVKQLMTELKAKGFLPHK